VDRSLGSEEPSVLVLCTSTCPVFFFPYCGEVRCLDSHVEKPGPLFPR
jgi:hypothetical protein